MATLPGLQKGITKDPAPPPTDTVIAPITIPNGTVLITSKLHNEIIDNLDQLIDYVSGDNSPNFIPQSAINNLTFDLAAKEILSNKVLTVGTPGNDTNYPTEKAVRDSLDLKEDSLGFTPEDSANKGAVSGYAALDSSQLLLLTNFPTGTALQVLRRNAGNDSLEFAPPAVSEVFTWTNDHSADNNNLTNLGELQFDANTTILRAGSNLDFNVATSSSFKFTIDPDVKLTITDTNTRLHGNNLQIEGGNISFDTANNFIDQVGNNLQFSLNENNALYEFLIGSNQTLSISALTTNNHNRKIINVSDPTNAQDVVTKAFGDANYLNADSLNDLSDVTITGTTINDILVSDVEGTFVNRQGVFTGITGLGIQTQDLVIGAANEIIMSDSTEIRWVNGNRRIFNDGTGFIFEVQDEDDFKLLINATPAFTLNQTNLTLVLGQTIDGVGLINFAQSGTSSISGIATALGIKVDLESGDIFRIDVDGTPEYTFNDSQADFAGNNLVNLGFIDFGAGSADAGTIRLPFDGSIQWEQSPPGSNIGIFADTSGETIDIRVVGFSADFRNTGLQIQGGDLIMTGNDIQGVGNFNLSNVAGTKIGTLATQKISFWNATPDVQPAHIIDANGTLADITTKFNSLLAQLASMGLQASV